MKLRSNNRGVSLIELSVALGVLSFTIATSAKTFTMLNSNSKKLRYRIGRDNIVKQIASSIQNSDSIAKTSSVPGNLAFSNCLSKPNGANDCLNNPNGSLPVEFQDAEGIVIAGGATPVRYDVDGNRCGLGGVAKMPCVLEAYTTFTATCKAGGTCPQAQTLDVDVQVQQAPGVEIPGVDQIPTRTQRAPANVQGSLMELRKTCLPGENYEGHDNWGNPVCTVFSHGDCPPNYFIYRYRQDLPEATNPGGVVCRSHDTICNPLTEIYQGSSGGGGWCITYAVAACPPDPSYYVFDVNFNARTVSCARRVFPVCMGNNLARVDASGNLYCEAMPNWVITYDASTWSMITSACPGRAIQYYTAAHTAVCFAPGDWDGDTWSDYVVGVREGGGPHVRVLTGTAGAEIGNFFAYDPDARFGVAVGMVDINGDGLAEVITAPGPGGGPAVHIFRPDGLGGGTNVGAYFSHPAGIRLGNTIGN